MAREGPNRGGRGRGRGQRSGRGGGRRPPRNFNSSTSSNSQGQQQIKLLQFAPHVQGKPQSATYASVRDHILTTIQKNFKDGQDVVQSLKDGKIYSLSSEEPK